MTKKYSGLKWLLFASSAVAIVAIILPFLGRKASLDEVLPVAAASAALAFSLTLFLLRQGALNVRVPSLRLTFRILGLVSLLGGAAVAVLAQLPISEKAQSAEFHAQRLKESRAKLKQNRPAKERLELIKLIEIDDDGGYMTRQVEMMRFYQRLAGGIAGGGLLLFVVSWFVPRRASDLKSASETVSSDHKTHSS